MVGGLHFAGYGTTNVTFNTSAATASLGLSTCAQIGRDQYWRLTGIAANNTVVITTCGGCTCTLLSIICLSCCLSLPSACPCHLPVPATADAGPRLLGCCPDPSSSPDANLWRID